LPVCTGRDQEEISADRQHGSSAALGGAAAAACWCPSILFANGAILKNKNPDGPVGHPGANFLRTISTIAREADFANNNRHFFVARPRAAFDNSRRDFGAR